MPQYKLFSGAGLSSHAVG